MQCCIRCALTTTAIATTGEVNGFCFKSVCTWDFQSSLNWKWCQVVSVLDLILCVACKDNLNTLDASYIFCRMKGIEYDMWCLKFTKYLQHLARNVTALFLVLLESLLRSGKGSPTIAAVQRILSSPGPGVWVSLQTRRKILHSKHTKTSAAQCDCISNTALSKSPLTRVHAWLLQTPVKQGSACHGEGQAGWVVFGV